MPSFLTNHAKARARSVQLDKAVANAALSSVAMPSQESVGCPPVPSQRSSSLPGQENENPAIRHYRSMLIVDAPTIMPIKPMDYQELYDQPPCYGTIRLGGLLQLASSTSLTDLMHRVLLIFCREQPADLCALQLPTVLRPRSPAPGLRRSMVSKHLLGLLHSLTCPLTFEQLANKLSAPMTAEILSGES